MELNQPSEKIIELGYVIGNPKSGEILCSNSILVNPEETLAEVIIDLTGITQEMVDGGTDIRSAYNAMVRDVNKYEALTVIHQWGVGDTSLLKTQLADDDLWKFGRRWLDVKALSQAHGIINGVKFYGGLRKLAARLGIQMSREKAHRADYDAEITFLLHSRLSHFFAYGYDLFEVFEGRCEGVIISPDHLDIVASNSLRFECKFNHCIFLPSTSAYLVCLPSNNAAGFPFKYVSKKARR